MLMLWVFRIDKGNIGFILIKRTNCMCKNIFVKKTDTIHFHSRQLKNDYFKISITRKLVKLMQK